MSHDSPDSGEPPAPNADQEPQSPRITDAEYLSLLASPSVYQILKRLQRGPAERAGFERLCRLVLKLPPEEVARDLALLVEREVVREIKVLETSDEAPEALAAPTTYLLLVQDYALVQKPLRELLQGIDQVEDLRGSPANVYRVRVKEYFATYATRSKGSDDQVALDVLTNPTLVQAVEFLRENVVRVGQAPKRLVQLWDQPPDQVFAALRDLGIVVELQGATGAHWALLADVEFTWQFPQYLINAINQSLQEQRIPKIVSLALLNALKHEYQRLEQPAKYQELMAELADLQNELAELLGAEDSPGASLLATVYDDILAVQKELGDFEGQLSTEHTIQNLQH
jgi:hypothetical protein